MWFGTGTSNDTPIGYSSVTGGTDNIVRGYSSMEPHGKWIVLSQPTIRSLRKQYVIYDYYDKTLINYFRFNKSWADYDGSVVYSGRLIKAYTSYKEMLPRWLELYRYFKQFDVGKDIFTHISKYYIEF